jgi:AcrR family transcriptional regulator
MTTASSPAQGRAAQKEATRRRLIDAAIALFAEKGYTGATVDEIAQRAGSTPTTLYLHFTSKVGLIPFVLKRADPHFDQAYRELAVIAAEPTPEAVRAWLHEMTTTWIKVAAVMKGVYEAAAVSPDARAALTEAQDNQTAALAGALRSTAPRLVQADAIVYANILLAPLTDYFGRFLRGEPFQRSRVVDALTTSWMAVIELCRARGGSPASTGHR